MSGLPVSIQSNLEGAANDLYDVLRIFVGEIALAQREQAQLLLTHIHREEGGLWHEECAIAYQGRQRSHELQAPVVPGDLLHKRYRKRAVKRCCYALLRDFFDYRPDWGSLTGIRPTRLLYEEWNRLGDLDAGRQALVQWYNVSEEKAALLQEIVLGQRGLMDEDLGAVDIYAGIPFCASRCAYCSFISEEIGGGTKLPAYFHALARELNAARDLVREKGLRVRAIYVGGGTPTAVPGELLAGLLAGLAEAFPEALEFTVEAGRPDSIDLPTLRLIREYPVTRISVNPQTMHDETLRRIGRAHTAQQTREAMALAREAGFDNVNMDLIAALPAEGLEDFRITLENVAEMSPQSLTVHTLAIKRASTLRWQQYSQAGEAEVAAMLRAAHGTAHDLGMTAYYLYRQKYMAAGQENVGYALPGRACRYNIDHMEETTSILALGAGGISKRLFHRELRIERAPNVSNIDHYIGRIDEMIERKRKLWA